MFNPTFARPPRRTFAPNSPLLAPTAGTSFVIETGWVGLYKANHTQGRLIGLLLPGDRIEPLTGTGHCIARACTSVVVKIDQTGSTTGREIDHVLRQCMRQHLVAPARALDLFAEIYERLFKMGLAADAAFKLPLNYGDLSELIGITAVHLSRVLKQLKTSGRVSIEGDIVRILRRAAITRLSPPRLVTSEAAQSCYKVENFGEPS